MSPKTLSKVMQLNRRWYSAARSDITWARHRDRISAIYPLLFDLNTNLYTQFVSIINTDFTLSKNIGLVTRIYLSQVPAKLQRNVCLVGEYNCKNNLLDLLRPSLFYTTDRYGIDDAYNLEPIDWTRDRDTVLNYFYNVLLDKPLGNDYVSTEWNYLDCTPDGGIVHLPRIKRIKL